MLCTELNHWTGNHSTVHWDTVMLTCIKSIDMLNKNTPGAKKSEAKSEAPVSSYSNTRLKKCDIWRRPRP